MPRLKTISKWPGELQESKVPSCVFYDKQGVARAFCAECSDEFTESKVSLLRALAVGSS